MSVLGRTYEFREVRAGIPGVNIVMIVLREPRDPGNIRDECS